MATYTITLANQQTEFSCRDDEFVLKAMERQGCTGVPVGCRSGGCGVCRIKIHSGSYACGCMNKAHASPEQQARGIALACRLKPTSNLVIECFPSDVNAKQMQCGGQITLQQCEVTS